MKAGLTMPMRLLRGIGRSARAAVFGQADLDHLVDAPGAAGERGLEHLGAVGGEQEQHARVGPEAVHRRVLPVPGGP